MQEFFERVTVFTKNSDGNLFRLNCIKRLSDGKCKVLTCDPIYEDKPEGHFLEREQYVLEMLLFNGYWNEEKTDVKLFDSLEIAVMEFWLEWQF